jgi:ribosomal protein S18 acetylase RimI-like enzyme
MLIRPYETPDWEALCRVHDAARPYELRPTVGLDAFLTLEQTAEEEGLFDASLDVLVVDEVVIGFAAYGDDELTWLYVDPDRFGEGHGRRLLRHVVARTGPVLQTEVLEGNEAALALYLSEGFTVVRRSEGKLAGNERFAAVGLVLEHCKPG